MTYRIRELEWKDKPGLSGNVKADGIDGFRYETITADNNIYLRIYGGNDCRPIALMPQENIEDAKAEAQRHHEQQLMKWLHEEETEAAYMCKTSFDWEIENCSINLYPSEDAIRRECKCVKQCGIVKVNVSLAEVVQEEDYSDLQKDKPQYTHFVPIVCVQVERKGKKMRNTICIYHGNCADGFTAAWVVRKALGDGVEFYAGVYQQDPPDVTDKNVILVDFSYKRPVLEKMCETAKSILILDHHKSAQHDLADWDAVGRMGECPIIEVGKCRVECWFDMERSGARMAWDHFFPGKEPGSLIKHVEDRDLWRFRMEQTRAFQANLFSYEYTFENWDMIDALCADDYKYWSFIEAGNAIERKHFKDIKEFINVAENRMVIAGHDVPCLNAPYFWSSDAGHIMSDNEPFAACYWDQPDGRVFSLRSNKDGIDVSEIAKQFGGGGHKNAAGFKVSIEQDVSQPTNTQNL